MIPLNKFSEFSNLLDQSFANKRKGIKNNLKKLEINFQKLNINPLARAEELSIEDFVLVFQNHIFIDEYICNWGCTWLF